MLYYQINSAFLAMYANHQYIETAGRNEVSQKFNILKSGLGYSQPRSPISPAISCLFLILFKSLFPLIPPALSSQAGSSRTHHGDGDNMLF